jgi:hypothetical protein
MALAVAPPPQSRKLAGSPPLSLMMSMVAIARPAPLTKHPIDPYHQVTTDLRITSNLIKFKPNSAALTSSGFS